MIKYSQILTTNSIITFDVFYTDTKQLIAFQVKQLD